MTDEQPARVIVAKDRVYRLEPGQQGQPVEEVFGATLAAFLKGKCAKVYEVDGRKIIARPDGEAQLLACEPEE